ncbi:unnamed protein product [Hermetia illucens]|uniref:Ionotropic receptor n=1 Tax=Hermetia illucens TaxID=343691 RepID=A0A7R8UBC3_HERIL|nr:unnamed protein product [Hermetia illucens]
MFAGPLLALVINGLLHESANLTRYISDIETNYRFHSLVFIAPNHSVLNIIDFKILKTPIIYLVDALIMEYRDFQNFNNLFVVFTENNELLSQRTVFYHSKSIVRHGKVMVWNVDVKQGSDSNHFQSIFELFWKKSILQVIAVNPRKDESVDVFTYTPFPAITISKVENRQFPFKKAPLNLMGYPVRSYVTGYSLILVSLYNSTLTSLYTTKVYEKALRTVEDMMEANLSIMVHDNEWGLEENLIEPKIFRKQFLPVDANVIHDHRDGFNTSFGYVSGSDKITWLLEQQTYFKRPLFRPPIYCFALVNMFLGMQYFTPYEEALDTVILQTFEAGLREKWLKESFDESVDAGIVKRIIVSESRYKPLILENLEYFWIFWACGMILSMISFIIETNLSRARFLATRLFDYM